MEDFFKILNESRHESGKGSKSGREAIHRKKSEAHTNPGKSRVRVYNSITDALKNGYMGQKFSTRNADRIYVVTHQKWGKDKEQIINGRSAKGFSTSTPHKRIEKYSRDTIIRHAGKDKRRRQKEGK
jgi:hypothetical protein